MGSLKTGLGMELQSWKVSEPDSEPQLSAYLVRNEHLEHLRKALYPLKGNCHPEQYADEF